MSEQPVARGPLDQVGRLEGPSVRVEPRPHAAMVNLRGAGDAAAFRDGVTAVLGATPPLEPNTVARGSGVDLLWCGPDEWLAVVWPEGPADAESRLADGLAGIHAAVTAVGAGHVALDLRGDGARALLARGCPLDLHERAFETGRCAQSVLGHATVTLHLRDPEPAFTLLVRRSMAGYLWPRSEPTAVIGATPWPGPWSPRGPGADAGRGRRVGRRSAGGQLVRGTVAPQQVGPGEKPGLFHAHEPLAAEAALIPGRAAVAVVVALGEVGR